MDHFDPYITKRIAKDTAKKILEAVYNPKINFIEYIEGIINE